MYTCTYSLHGRISDNGTKSVLRDDCKSVSAHLHYADTNSSEFIGIMYINDFLDYCCIQVKYFIKIFHWLVYLNHSIQQQW